MNPQAELESPPEPNPQPNIAAVIGLPMMGAVLAAAGLAAAAWFAGSGLSMSAKEGPRVEAAATVAAPAASNQPPR